MKSSFSLLVDVKHMKVDFQLYLVQRLMEVIHSVGLLLLCFLTTNRSVILRSYW